MKKVAVLQSSYLPWKGYFDIVNSVDTFVFYDDVQFTKNDWRNRNRIKTEAGASWLTIPVGDKIDRLICEVDIHDQRWAAKHWKSLKQYYSKSPFFKDYQDFFENLFLVKKWNNLSVLNQYIIQAIAKEMLGVKTEFLDSRDFFINGKKGDRLVNLLVEVGANYYLSGPSARDYIDEELFVDAGIQLDYQTYAGYPEYSQNFPPFEHHVSIVDLLFHVGPAAQDYIWGWRKQ